MSSEPIYLSTDESEYSTPNSTPDHYLESKYPDSYETINQLIGSQFKQTSIIGTATVPLAPTRNACVASDDDDQHNRTPIIGNPAQYTSHIPQRRRHPNSYVNNYSQSWTHLNPPIRSISKRHFSSV